MIECYWSTQLEVSRILVMMPVPTIGRTSQASDIQNGNETH